ncbi:MAG: signal peptidase I [Armatimonadota bacterium]
MNIALENTWHIIGLIGVAVALRVAVPRIRGLQERYRNWCLEIADSALIALLLVFCIIRPFVIQAFYIPSGSMKPTLQIGDRILVNKFIYRFRPPRPGEIVVFKAPRQALREDEGPRDFIKRCIGVPGDVIEVHDGKLWRNGKPVHERPLLGFRPDPTVQYEPYTIMEPPAYEWQPHIVPPDSIFVFGDNRNESNDSHRWELYDENGWVRAAPAVPVENVLGKAMVIFWPLDRIRALK